MSGMNNILSLILGGGQGSRLFPLTKDRSKPAVPIGGKYRLIDIPISNCLNSNINKIYILTQFNSASLNKHINHTYRFDSFHKGFVDILAAEQSIENTDWYQGTADAVRKNLKHILAYPDVKYVLILSGDQIYSLNYKDLYDFHISSKADVTISAIPVEESEVSSFGIVKIDEKNQRVTQFIEKPSDKETIDSLNYRNTISKLLPKTKETKTHLASMGIYLFNIDVLIELLNNNYPDFGKEIIPLAIEKKKVFAFLFDGYWEDVGTIKSFWKANIDFAKREPEYNIYQTVIYTNPRHLPPSRVINSNIDQSILSEGSIIYNSKITSSIIGIRSIIKDNVEIENSIIMGADFYEQETPKNSIPIGIGENTIIKNAIIDKNARIGANCKITNINNLEKADGRNYYIRDGIIIIPKNVTIPDNTIL